MVGGENDPTRVDVIPLDGAPACSAPATQFTQATSGLGLSGGLVNDIPVICGEEGVNFECHKLNPSSNIWSPVASGVRFFEAAMTVYNGNSEILAIGGR